MKHQKINHKPKINLNHIVQDNIPQIPISPIRKKKGIQNSKIVQSAFLVCQDYQFSQCAKCKKLSAKLQKLSIINQYVSFLKQQNLEFKEEIQFLYENFKYIMHLASQNVSQGMSIKIKKIFHQKQNLIKNKQKIIQRLQNQSQFLMSKVDANNDYEQKITKMEERIKQLERQNSFLKDLAKNAKITSSYKSQSHLIASTKDQQFEIRIKEPPSLTYQSSQKNLLQKDQKRGFSIRKLKTLQNFQKSQQSPHKASLSDLQHKINKIREQILNSS